MKANQRLRAPFLTNILLVLSIFFFKQGQTGTRWGTLAGLSLTETITKELDCHRLKFLTNQQKGICQKYVEVMDAVKAGTSDALKECRHQFKDRRWNCSFVDSNNPFGNLLKTGSKETAFVYSIISAGVTHAVARGCSTGRLRKCGCDKTLNGQSEEGFEWSGCSDNVAYGSAFAMTFLDPREHLRKKSLLPRAMMNLHNNNVGRKIVENNMKIQCKCHGVSGSCEMKTCWKTLPSFREVGDALKALYDRAQMVELRKLGSRLELVALSEPYVDSFQVYQGENIHSQTHRVNKTPNADKTFSKNKNLTKEKPDKKINKTTGYYHTNKTTSYSHLNNTTTENLQIDMQFSTENSSHLIREPADVNATTFTSTTDYTLQNSLNNNMSSISASRSAAHLDEQKRQLSKRRINTRQSEMKTNKENTEGLQQNQKKFQKQQKRNREWIPYNAPIFKRQPEAQYHVSSGENQVSHDEKKLNGQLRGQLRQKKLTSFINISTEHLPYNEQHEKYLSLPNRKLPAGKSQQLLKRRQHKELLKRRQRQQRQDKQERLPESPPYVNEHNVFMNEPQIPHSFFYDQSGQLSLQQVDSFIERNDTIFNFYQEFSMDNELVYIESSPNYCEADRLTGSLGTIGRVCSIEDGSDNHQNCHSLCCGRGYTVRRLVVTERCQCRFQWCCEVKCQKCRREVLEYTCR